MLEYRDTGAPAAFRELVRRYERKLYGYLWNRLHDTELAADAFQQAFLQVHLKCDRFDSSRQFRPWLYTLAINQAIDLQRQNNRHRSLSLDHPVRGKLESRTASMVDLIEGDDHGPFQRADAAEQADLLRQAMDELPDAFREAVHLVYFRGLQYQEAAEVLAIPVGTVKSRVHAAVRVLDAALRPLYADA